MATALTGGVLLAWAMNDEPLGAVHGAPVRVVVPGHIGARSVKWLERVVVQGQPSDNYFQATAYRVLPPGADPDQAGPGDGISLGPVALNCEILRPQAGQDVGAGGVEVVGYAHAGAGRYVARVDVSVDGGEHWVQADLGERVDGAWRTWRVTAGPVVGAAAVVARAWDSTGACQPSSPEHLWNPKGYVNNSWPVVPVRGA
jgi:sulfite oxidase